MPPLAAVSVKDGPAGEICPGKWRDANSAEMRLACAPESSKAQASPSPRMTGWRSELASKVRPSSNRVASKNATTESSPILRTKRSRPPPGGSPELRETQTERLRRRRLVGLYGQISFARFRVIIQLDQTSQLIQRTIIVVM